MVQVDVQVLADEVAEHGLWIGLEDSLRRVGRELVFGLRARNLDTGDRPDRQVFDRHGFLRQRVHEPRRHDAYLVDLTVEEHIPRHSRDRSRLGIDGRIAVRELGHQLPLRAGDELRRLAARRDVARGRRIELRGEAKHVGVERTAQTLVGRDEDDGPPPHRANFEQRMLETGGTSRGDALNPIEPAAERLRRERCLTAEALAPCGYNMDRDGDPNNIH